MSESYHQNTKKKEERDHIEKATLFFFYTFDKLRMTTKTIHEKKLSNISEWQVNSVSSQNNPKIMVV
jgi:hypothetical protein